MGDVVDLHPAPFKDDHEFVVDLARFAEGITTEEAIRKKYRLAEEVWTKLGDDDELVRAITDEKTRRIRSGATKRKKHNSWSSPRRMWRPKSCWMTVRMHGTAWTHARCWTI